MTRAECIAEATRLRRQGWFLHDLATYFGVSRTTIHGWVTPGAVRRVREADRARRERYRGRCRHCGALTNGSDGAANAPLECPRCSPARCATGQPSQVREPTFSELCAVTLRRSDPCSCDGLQVLDEDGDPTCSKCGRAKREAVAA